MTANPTIITQKGEKGGPSKTFTLCPTDVYAQTLFLGCSVKSFNCSLAWGAESSRLTVELAYDPCDYPYLNDINKQQIPRPTDDDAYTTTRLNNTFRYDDNGNALVPGKVYYVPSTSAGKIVSKYWYEKDPGFYAEMPNPADSIEIVGCPVYFKYNDFEFYGIVKSWDRSVNESSTQSYTVTIESPSSLLSQTEMILSTYTGAIFSKDNSGYGFPNHHKSTYTGKVAEQMISNIVNVYGYLEDSTNITTNLPLDPDTGDPQYQFGRSNRTDNGIKANLIVLAVGELLGSSQPFTKQKILRYAPFGRMVGPVPKKKSDATDAPLTLDKYKMGLIPPIQDPAGQYRSLYAINLQELVNIVPDYYRIGDSNMTILNLANKLCDDSGKNMFVEMVLSIESTGVYPVIKVRTVDTLSQPISDAVDSYLQELALNQRYVVSYTKGEEYNTDKTVRSMYIGGKQQRLYQVRNSKYAAKQSTIRYNAFTNSFTTIDHSVQQKYRLPNPSSYRNPAYYIQTTQGSLFSRLQLPDNFTNSEVWDNQIQTGNYYPIISIGPVGTVPSRFPSSDTDAICPYFGYNDITFLVRKVFSDSTGFLVEFTTTELAAAMGLQAQTPDTVLVSETEIRAAMAGMDQYVGFLSGVLDDYIAMCQTRPELATTSVLETWTKVLKTIFAEHFPLAMNYGIMKTYNLLTNSQSGTQSVPSSPSSSYITDNVAFNSVVKLQQYLKKVGDEHYGKAYMVNIPTPAFWYDSADYVPTVQTGTDENGKPKFGDGNKIKVGTDINGYPIYMQTGTQKSYFSFEPADYAWEEPGNNIDDTLVVGETSLYPILEENGAIPAILGFNNNPQYNYGKNFAIAAWEVAKNNLSGGSPSNYFNFWKYDIWKNGSKAYPVPALSIQNNTDPSWQNSLVLSNNADSVVIKSYMPLNPATDAFGKSIPNELVSKAYVKGNVKKELMTYANSAGIISAKMIVTVDPMFLNPSSPSALSVSAAVVEFLSGYYLGSAAARAAKVLAMADMFDPNNQANQPNPNNNGHNNKQFKNMGIAPKAAMPCFAGLPVMLNGYVYGPWINAPDLQIDTIFPNDPNKLKKLENIVGGTKLEINPDLVPWNYGSMAILDEAARILVGQDNNYQLKSESGQIVVYGIPKIKLGDELKATTYTLRGPTVSNISLQFSKDTPTTTYTFRTFTRKFTLFNKDSADRLKNSAQATMKLQREMRQRISTVLTKINNISSMPLPSTNAGSLGASKLLAYSPMSVLVGYSSPSISPKATNPKGINPYQPGTWTKDSLKQSTTVTIQDYRELSQEFDNGYSAKAFMSLDGLLTPVSFYPTLNNSTTSYKKYNTSYCPFCKGTKQYTVNNTEYYCDFCETKSSRTNSSASSFSTIPPYIVASGDDATIIKNLPAVEQLISDKTQGVIDYINLNPIIMPMGELRNKFAQDTDNNAHHIDIIGRSLVPMKGSISHSDNLAIDQSGLEYYDLNKSGCYLDYNAENFDEAAELTPGLYQMNHRFLGLRGPMVMAGWGYDTEGYPVPNASGEPQEVNESGFPKRISDSKDLTGSFDPSYSGVILGKNQTVVSGEWTKPKKEMSFSQGWGLRPDTWPVGPIDLRWDDNRKVWVSPPPPDPFVALQLEDDLVPPYPARAFLNDYDRKAPLPSGLRRMVFVKDPFDAYGAPRGAKLLCKYNAANGFYEPAVKPDVLVSGIIVNSTTAQIYQAFDVGSLDYTESETTPDPIQVNYGNPLNFKVQPNDPGIFIYLKNGWILMSANRGC